MKKNFQSQIIILITGILLISCNQNTESQSGNESKFSELKGPYLGQKPPGMIPEVFAPGIISTKDHEIHLASSLDGRELYYTYKDSASQDPFTIYYIKEVNGKWTSPQAAPFNRDGYNSVSAFSPDGNRLFFIAAAAPNVDETKKTRDIWYVDREKGGWAEPVHMEDVVNSRWNDTYPSVSNNGNLYFTSDRERGFGGYDIYCSEYKDGVYQIPVNLGPAVNTSGGERHAYIAADESYILFDSEEPERRMGLYVSFRKSSGTWTTAKCIGEEVNRDPVIFHVNMSLDGKYIFTSSNPRLKKTSNGTASYYNRDIYWVDAKIIVQRTPSEKN